MPFKSEKQRRYMWKFHPDIARRWTEEMKKNPASEGFVWLDNGAFSDIYRSGFRVEALVCQNRRGEIDLSKDILVSVRQNVSDNAKRFLPDIHRKRIDKLEDGTLQFIYEMPYYEKYEERSSVDGEFRLTSKTARLEEQMEILADSGFSDEDTLGMAEALSACRLEAEKLGLKFVNDFRSRNLVLQGNQLILLDTFYVIDDNADKLIARWKTPKFGIAKSAKQLLKSLTQNR